MHAFQSSQPLYQPRLRRGFTLPELLVVLGVVMVVLSLALPALARARLAATKLSCSTRVRDLGGLVAAYAIDHDDLFPSAIGDGPNIRNNQDRWNQYTFQIFATFPREPWRTWAGLGRHSEVLYCPSNQYHSDLADDESDPDFVLSASVFAEVRYFDPAMPEAYWKTRLGAKVQRHSAAVFPDRKVGILEHRVWHGWRGSACQGCPIDGLFYFDSPNPGSLWFLDGHVELRLVTDALPHVYRSPIWPVMPFGTTAYGIAGRDVQ